MEKRLARTKRTKRRKGIFTREEFVGNGEGGGSGDEEKVKGQQMGR